MSTLTVYADLNNTWQADSGVDYATALAGGNATESASALYITVQDQRTGQVPDPFWYYLSIGHIRFPTSALPDDASISSAVVSLNCYSPSGNQSDIELANWDGSTGWNPDVATLFSSIPNGNITINAYNDFPSSSALIGVVNKTGDTYVTVRDSFTGAGTGPSDTLTTFYGVDQTGTTIDPKITLTYTTPVASHRAAVLRSRGGF